MTSHGVDPHLVVVEGKSLSKEMIADVGQRRW